MLGSRIDYLFRAVILHDIAQDDLKACLPESSDDNSRNKDTEEEREVGLINNDVVNIKHVRLTSRTDTSLTPRTRGENLSAAPSMLLERVG